MNSVPGPIMAMPQTDVAAVAADDVPALLSEREFHALYSCTAAPLRAYVVRSLGHATNADDIVQETYLRVLRKPVPTREDRELRAYVFRIAGNLIVDQWRARRREATSEIPDAAASGRDLSLRLDVSRVFARLKPRDRQMMWLAHVEGANHKEIAAALGLRAGSVRVLLSRVRQRFGRMLRADGHAPGGTR